MKWEYFNILLANDTYICRSLQRFGAIALKTKNLWRKVRLSSMRLHFFNDSIKTVVQISWGK